VSATPRLSVHRELPSTARRGARLALFVVVACFAFGIASDVRASCGDYVTIAGEHAMAMQDHLASPSQPGLPSAPLAGCRGPDCHRHAPPPMNPSRDLPTTRSYEHAFWLTLAEPPVLTATRFIFDCPAQPLDGHQRRIEHPPRLVG
jgi:hypothetical protein